MSDRRSLAALLLLMMLGGLAFGAIAIGFLYRASADQLMAAAEDAGRALAAADAGEGASSGSSPRFSAAGRHGTAIGRLEDGVVTLVDPIRVPGGDLARSSAIPPAAELLETMRRPLAGESGTTTFIANDGRRFLAAFVPVPGHDLGVVSYIPIDDVRSPLRAAGWNLLWFGVPLLLMAVAVSALLGRTLLRRNAASRGRANDLMGLLRTSIVVVHPVDNDWLVADINDAAARSEAVRREEVIGRRLVAALPALCSTQILDTVRRVARTGAAEQLPAAPPPPGAAPLWREFSVHRLPDGDVVIAADDVTARRRAEEALRESEARWRLILETEEQAIVILDRKLDIRFVNRAAEALFAKPSQDLIGAPFGYPLVRNELAEIEILHPHHGIAYAEMRVVPTRWAGEEQYVVFLRDVSAYKRTEGDLRKLFQAIEQSPVSVVITDVDGSIEYVNPKFTETTGYTYAEVVGKNPRVLRSGLTSSLGYQALWQTISSGQVWHGEFYNRRKNGEYFWELASIAPVRDVRGQITHYVAMKEDISERKATEERLRHSQRMEMIGQLTGGLAHDFNNLLAIIIGNLQLLEERDDTDPESRELISDALWSAERGAQLTHRLLAFARRQRLNPQRTDLNGVVGEMTGLLRRTIGEKIRINESFAPDLWETMADRSQLENSLLNLVVNARDAMAGEGVLQIRTANIQLPASSPPRGEETRPGDYVLLEVADTGAGMSSEVLERIFEPFFTTKKLGEGSGLGLSMVYGFVRQSGGQIFVDSTPGKGTTVRLCLPRARDAVDEGGVAVLGACVDDDPDPRAIAIPDLRHDPSWPMSQARSSPPVDAAAAAPDRGDLMGGIGNRGGSHSSQPQLR
ncbi:MAG: PAS domain S-box protein [Rhodospirillales bacterium]